MLDSEDARMIQTGNKKEKRMICSVSPLKIQMKDRELFALDWKYKVTLEPHGG